MAFRNEHEAALQRAAALERERNRAKREQRRAERQLAEARRERDELADQLDATRRRLIGAGLDEATAIVPQQRGSAAALAFVAVMAAAVIGPTLCHSASRSVPPPIAVPEIAPVSIPLPPLPEVELERCTIRSTPAAAEVFLDGQPETIGRTPIWVLRSDWELAGGIEVRLEDHGAVAVPPPPNADGCDRTIWLAPASP